MRFAQAARKHRIGQGHALYVMDNSDPAVLEEPDKPVRFVWLAPDDRGIDLEIVALDLADYLLVIHVMPHQLRRRSP